MSKPYKVLTSKALQVAKINTYLIKPSIILAWSMIVAMLVAVQSWMIVVLAVGFCGHLYTARANTKFLNNSGFDYSASSVQLNKPKRTFNDAMRPLDGQQLEDMHERALDDESLQAYIRDILKVQGREMLVIDYKYALKQADDAKAQQEELALKQSEEARIAMSRKKIESLITGGTKSE